MQLGKFIILCTFALLVSVLCGCAKDQEYIEYDAAKTLFKVGMNESTIIEKFGKPNNVLDFGTLTKWFYDHEAIVKSLQVGETRKGFSIDFKDGKATKIDPIIVTRR